MDYDERRLAAYHAAGDWETYNQWCAEHKDEALAYYAEKQREDAERQLEVEQISAAEVPGFHARTVIDDTIGKLYAIRSRIRVPVPDGLAAVLDDIEALAEQAIDLALDPDAPEVDDGYGEAFRFKGAWTTLHATGSTCISHCSCGGLFVSAPEPPTA